MKLDHVGYVTNNLKLFEKFWVKELGFKKIFESTIESVMNRALFNTEGAKAIRYKKNDTCIEVHVYDIPVKPFMFPPFNQFGINHIAIWVKNRDKFMQQHDFDKRIYHNPKGWDNIFIKDYEGNWIEVRTTL